MKNIFLILALVLASFTASAQPIQRTRWTTNTDLVVIDGSVLNNIPLGSLQALPITNTQTGVTLTGNFSGSLVGTNVQVTGGAGNIFATNGTVFASSNLQAGGTFIGNAAGLTNLPPGAIQYRAGFSNLANLSVSQAVTFVVAFPASVGTNYTPSVSFLGAALAGAVSPSYNAITTNGFTVNLSVGITGGENFVWTALPWTTPAR